MGIYSIKPKFQLLLQPVTSLLIKYKVHPDVLNVSGLAFSLLAALAIYYSSINIIFLLLILPFVSLRLTVNALDGQVSRGLGLASRWGEVKNEVLDRISDSLIILALAFAGEGLFIWVSLALALTLIHSFVGVLAKAVGLPRNYVGLMGKADRMFFLAFACLVVFISKNTDLFKIFMGLFVLLLTISLGQKLHNVRSNL